MWRTTPKNPKPSLPRKQQQLQLEEEEEMEGADSDADGNTNATYEVLTTTRAIYSEKTVAITVKESTTKTATPKESEDIYRGAGQRHRPEMCSQTEYGGLHYRGSPMVTPGGTDNC